MQTTAPYNLGAFRIRIDYPADYPFKPPKIKFETPIYHPNVDEAGQVCLSIIQPQNWKAATKTDDGLFPIIIFFKFNPWYSVPKGA